MRLLGGLLAPYGSTVTVAFAHPNTSNTPPTLAKLRAQIATNLGQMGVTAIDQLGMHCLVDTQAGAEPVREHLLISRYSPQRVQQGEMLSLEDVVEILAIPLLAVIPESESVLKASNAGTPVILDDDADAGQAYADAVARFLGEERPHRHLDVPRRSILQRLFG